MFYLSISSGIGEGLAHAYAKDKISLVLIARNMGKLSQSHFEQ